MKRAELEDQMLQATEDVDLAKKEEEEPVALECELEGLRVDVTTPKHLLLSIHGLEFYLDQVTVPVRISAKRKFRCWIPAASFL